MLAKIRPPGSTVDHLFVGTIRFQYFTAAWNTETRKLETVQQFTDVSERHIRESQSRDICSIDPTGTYLMLELFEGVINLIKVLKPRKGRDDYLQKPEQIRLAELKVRASAFLHTEIKQPKVAFLYEDGTGGDVRLATYRIVDERLQWARFDATKDRENSIGGLCLGASHLIPVAKGEAAQKRYMVRNSTVIKAHLGGVIIVGETKMTYLDDESKATVEHVLDEASVFCAWEQLDDLNYLLADIYSKLYLLTILLDGVEVVGMSMRLLGLTSKATAMVHLGGGIVFIASHESDCQLIRVDIDPNSEVLLEKIQTIENIAPILDFAVMDMASREGEAQTNEYSTGQARLVTGSGAFQGGSLRSVRSGVGLGTLGECDAEMTEIQKLFSLRSQPSQEFDDILAISLPTETRMFRFSGNGEIEELDQFRGTGLHLTTLLALNLPDGLVLQVTPESAAIYGAGQLCKVSEWKPPEGQQITAASANYGYVLLSANGTTLVSLKIGQGLKEVAAQTLENGEQVACLHVPDNASGVGVVGFWKSGSISVLDINSMEILHSEELRRKNNASIPRAIAMTQMLPIQIAGPTLFVAMEDGVVLTFNVDKSTHQLSGRKNIILGTQQAQFHIIPGKDQLFNIFATCEHPSLIYGEEGRIVYSAVTAEHAISVCSFNNEAYPGAIAVATPLGIQISQVDTQRRTHVRTTAMNKTVRRIAYSATERVFALGCIKRELVDAEEIVSSSFQLVDDVNYDPIGQEILLKQDGRPELIECITRAELNGPDGNLAERFVVGTSFLDEGSMDYVRGRIIVIGVDHARDPHIITSYPLRGACRRIATMGQMIVAALNKTVVIYDYVEETEQSAELTKMATYRTATVPIDLSIHDDFIAVADLMQSMSVVEIKHGENGMDDKLEEVARHFQATWSTGVIYIDDDSYLQSDHDGNLMVLRRNVDGVTVEDQKRMELISSMNLGEMVNKIQRINVEPTSSAMVIPKAFLATVSLPRFFYSSMSDIT
jgi:DNA damage-binding protein 1